VPTTRWASRRPSSLIDDRIREIIRLGESIVVDNADRLMSCLVLAAEDRP